MNTVKNKCMGCIKAIRLKRCRKVVTVYMTETLNACSHFISLTDLKKNSHFFVLSINCEKEAKTGGKGK